MVAHWSRTGGRKSRQSMLVNGLGAVATAITVVVVIIAKFVEGAWVTVLLITGIIVLMISIRRHYDQVAAETANPVPLDVSGLGVPLVVVPMLEWDKIAQKALRFALNISPDVQVLHIDCGEETENLRRKWPSLVKAPTQEAGLPTPQLVVLKSPYRFVITPILDYVLDLERRNPDRQVAVLIPEMVEQHWYHYFLHNQRARWLEALLLIKGNQRIVVINVPWYLSA